MPGMVPAHGVRPGAGSLTVSDCCRSPTT
jgi:hypothetical protein